MRHKHGVPTQGRVRFAFRPVSSHGRVPRGIWGDLLAHGPSLGWFLRYGLGDTRSRCRTRNMRTDSTRFSLTMLAGSEEARVLPTPATAEKVRSGPQTTEFDRKERTRA